MTSLEAISAFIQEKIKVLGIGGAGCKVIDKMISKGLEGVDFVAIDTDVSNLTKGLAKKKINIGLNMTKGLGAGGNSDIGRKAAKNSEREIKDILQNTDIVFIVCGLCGGTGSGATPIIANIAKEMGIFTIAILTNPFSVELYERPQRKSNTEEGIKKLNNAVDSLIIIPNDKIIKITEKEINWKKAFSIIDTRLLLLVQGISDILTKPGDINIEFTDIKVMMSNSGTGSIGIGYGTGKKKTINATKNAIEDFGLYNDLNKTKNIILGVTGGDDLTATEVREASSLIENIIGKDISYMWCMVYDKTMKNEAKATIIGTGLEK